MNGKRAIMPLVLLLSAAACDQEIDPIATTEMAFSIYGVLDVNADTQWVRVGPFRTSIFSTPDSVDAVVAIEELETGRTIEMVADLFSQQSGNFNDTLFAYNFRTTERILPKSTYRLTARRSDGPLSSSLSITPDDFRDSIVVVGFSRNPFVPDYVRFFVPAGAHVAMVNTLVFPIQECAFLPVLIEYNSLPPTPPPPGGGEHQVNVRQSSKDWGEACLGYPGIAAIDRQEIRIALSGEAWPFDPGHDISHINAVDNVENGVGFLGGVITKDVLYERACSISGPGAPPFCELTYGLETATLFVTAVNGSPGLLVNAPVARLISGTDNFGRAGTNIASSGAPSPIFRFQRVVPGTYRLRVEVPSNANPTPFYCEERAVTLTPGERHIEVVMVPRLAFPNEPVNANGCREG